MAARHPANMGLLLRMTLHVTLQMLLALEAALAARLLALELDLLDNCREVLETKVRSDQLLLG